MFSGYRKTHEVTRRTLEYIKKAEQCLGLFRMAFEVYLAQGPSSQFDELVTKVDMTETECDELRRNFEEELYQKALIPESRADIMDLLEKTDKVPNRAERLLFQIQAENLTVPPSLAGKFRQLMHVNVEAFDELARAFHALFEHSSDVRSFTSNVRRKESAADTLELEIIRMIFRQDDIPGDQRILLRDLVTSLSRISDAAETVSEMINVIVVKRLV